MASAGTVTIDFAAETAKFTAEMKKVRGQLADLQKQGQIVSKGFASAGRLITGAFAGITIGAAIRAVVRATAEAEESSARLENALKSSSAAAALSVDQLKGYASELQRTTTFSDEAVQEVQALLLSFRGLSGETILKATSAVADLSARMGIDLKSAALQVGKALSDPEKGLSALARSGVRFSEAQQQTIKRLAETGQLAKAQGLILAELETRFGGAARAARDTFGGALTGVSNAFGDLLEAKGGMPGATAALNALATTLNSPEVKAGFDSVIGGISKLIELSAQAASALPKLGANIGDFAVSALNIKVFEGAAARLRAELQFEEQELRRMQGLFSVASDEQIERQRAYIETLKERVKLAERAAAAERPPITPVVTTPQRVNVATQPEFDFEARQKVLEARQSAITASIQTMAGALDAFDAQQTEIERRRFASLDKTKALNDERMAESMRQYLDQLNREVDATIEAEQRKFDAVALYEKQKEALQQNAFAAGVGLLQAMSVRSKSAAKALILINRGLQIAQAVQNTAAAVTNALANVPYPWNLAAAAQVGALGAVQIGLIAATGVTEINNINRGNSGGIGGSNLGTPANPLPVADQAAVGAQQNKQIHITFEGVVTSSAARAIAEALKDVIDNSDVVLFSNSSRQAAEIRGE
jgi:hypothetical protein